MRACLIFKRKSTLMYKILDDASCCVIRCVESPSCRESPPYLQGDGLVEGTGGVVGFLSTSVFGVTLRVLIGLMWWHFWYLCRSRLSRSSPPDWNIVYLGWRRKEGGWREVGLWWGHLSVFLWVISGKRERRRRVRWCWLFDSTKLHLFRLAGVHHRFASACPPLLLWNLDF